MKLIRYLLGLLLLGAATYLVLSYFILPNYIAKRVTGKAELPNLPTHLEEKVEKGSRQINAFIEALPDAPEKYSETQPETENSDQEIQITPINRLTKAELYALVDDISMSRLNELASLKEESENSSIDQLFEKVRQDILTNEQIDIAPLKKQVVNKVQMQEIDSLHAYYRANQAYFATLMPAFKNTAKQIIRQKMTEK